MATGLPGSAGGVVFSSVTVVFFGSTQCSRTVELGCPDIRFKLLGEGISMASQTRAPRKQTAAMGTQYFRQAVITWSIRNRGNVQRIQIMKVTPTTALRMKLMQPARLARYPLNAQSAPPGA